MGLAQTTFAKQGFGEKEDLQRLLRQKIEIIAPDTLIIAEEFSDWEDSSRRIDLLAIDREANLVVIELKRTDDGGHMELQALRYAAMISAMDFDRAINTYAAHLSRSAPAANAREELLKFLGWVEPEGKVFAQQVKIILVSADFSKEITTSVIWLNEQGLDIVCVRMKPFVLEGRTLVDVQQIIPLPEAAEYTVRLRRKAEESRSPFKIIYPELNAVLTAYEASATDLRTLGKAHYYRYITVREWHNSSVHYEFYQGKDYIGAELQLESDAVLPLAEVLKKIAGKTVGDNVTALEWDPSWMAGRGRLRARFSLNSNPQVVAQAMRDLISLTRKAVTERIKDIQVAS